ncbi:hypothetical protein EYW49_22350 [Siculibacillus lacustris]|uniref:Uncharacterized protein n=1 Tax=Siculibacillus lacustris TaxID=1549641 RepID=A0A4Q9VCI4_9HYPH|nr:DUF6508 domain-containing protein [Siculibacillus lacustris]TBW32256.1 hypothetical protein EYW49_22350 [Siculibacillus lacustris]
MTDAIDALRSLVAMLPDLEADGASFGEMIPMRRAGKNWALPRFDFNKTGERFHSLGHVVGNGLSADDWKAWEREADCAAFLVNGSLPASVSLVDVRHLLVSIVQRERFCEGAMQSALDAGLVGSVVRRAAALLS